MPSSPSSCPATRRAAGLVAMVSVLALAGCGNLFQKPKDPEKNESWPTGSCVIIDGEKDVDPADCNGRHDGKVIGNIPPMTIDGKCPSGTDKRVREDQVTGDGSLIQEFWLCLETPRPTTRQNLETTFSQTAIKQFRDPAGELESNRDLVAYLLPGISGPGESCVSRELGDEDVLAQTPAEGAKVAGDLVVLCFDGPGIGRLLAVYNYMVGTGTTRGSDYRQYIDCLETAVAGRPEAEQREAVTKVFEARLDLEGAVGSPKVASQQLTALAPDC